MASTIKVDTIDTPSGAGNITISRPIVADIAVGSTLPAIDGSALTNIVHTPADNSVTGAKLNISLVAGDTMYASGTDTLAKLAKGTAAQVLTMNAGATAPEWAAAGGGAWTHIETITPSAAATATFSHPSLSATYRDYAIYMSDIFAASNSKYFRMQIGTGSSVTWKTSGYYSSCDYRWASNATYWREDANNANSYIIAGDSAGSSTAGCGMSGVLYLFDRTNDYVGWRSSFVNNWQSAYPGWCNAAGHAGQSNITNVRFLWESDVNFVANGYMALYGRVLP